MTITRFEDIEAWQLARELNRRVYAITRDEPFSRDWALRDQIRRAAGSTMHNIAEGFDAGSNSEFVRFLRYSQRSCREVESELYVALDEGYLTEASFEGLYRLADAVHKKDGGFIHYLQSHSEPKNGGSTSHDTRKQTKN
jgi:four helix bundle protein